MALQIISAVGEAIGVVAGVVAAFPVLKDLFAPPKDQTSTVRIFLGSNVNTDASLSGNIPGVALWDEFGNSIGKAKDSGKMPQGTFHDLKIVANDDVGNITPAYISVSAGGDDAICISSVLITAPDGTQATFSGDIPKLCGATWFESKTEIGQQHQTPACFWIDQNDSNGLNHQGFGAHIRDFINSGAQAAAYGSNTDLACKSGPRFRMYEQLANTDEILFFDPPLEYNADGTDADLSLIIDNPGAMSKKPQSDHKRRRDHARMFPATNKTLPGLDPTQNLPLSSSKQRPWKFPGQMVVSHKPHHSAERLCKDDNSWGPDFVAMQEQKFCSMEKKILYDLCSAQKTTCCFDVQSTQVRPCAGHSLLAESKATPNATYSNVQTWM